MAFADVSAIIPYYNAPDTIGKSIRSVVQQSLRVKELIIIDDCSSDYTVLSTIVEGFKASLPIRVLRLKVNSGASEARNQGVKIATGKYLAFLDSDDVWHCNKIEIQYSLMERLNLSLCAHLYVPDLNYGSMDSTLPLHIKSVLPIRFTWGNPFFTPTVMAKRDGFILFDSRYRRVDDYRCWLMNIKNNDGYLITLTLAGGFKPAVGYSGLTSSFKVMHESYVRVLGDLYREHHVDLFFYLTALLIEQIKYPVRVAKHIIAKR